METNLSESELDMIVLKYLENRQYKTSSNALRKETKLTENLKSHTNTLDLRSESFLKDYIMFYGETNLPQRYSESYTELRNWVDKSLDMYKNELNAIIYPIFVHCYLNLVSKGNTQDAKIFLQKYRSDHSDKHNSEINLLAGITTPENLKEDQLANTWRQNKFIVKMSSYSYELLISFIHETKLTLILSIINQYIKLNIVKGQPSSSEEYIPITGLSNDEMSRLNEKQVLWGLLNDSTVNPFIVSSNQQDKSVPVESSKKRKTDTAETKPVEAPQISIIESKIPLPPQNEERVLEALSDIKQKVNLHSKSLPSICMFTFLNSKNNLNTINISDNSRYVSAGFSDSSVRVWDLKKEEDQYTSFVGHSGPVFATSFSPDKKYLLSAGEDTTVRLWSLETNSNLMCYRGHNFPVWDVQFSPIGYYFATCSNDRTARIWSTDKTSPLRIMAGHLSDVDCVKFHPNCNYIATGSNDKTVRLWEINSGECVRIFTSGHFGSIYALAFSTDGKILASAGEDNKIILWDIATSKKIKVLTGHTKPIWSLDFSKESTLLASGSSDYSVRLWDVNAARSEPTIQAPVYNNQSTELIQTFHTKKTSTYHVSFTNKNLLLAAGCFNSTSNDL